MELLTVDPYGNETNIEGNGVNIFGSDEWEPGQTRVVYFKIVSHSNINVKYILSLIVADDNLEGALEYCAVEGKYTIKDGDTWKSLTRSRTVYPLTRGQNSISGDTHVPITPSEAQYYTLFIHMREDASDCQGKSSTIDVYLYAMQGNANAD